MMRRVLCLTGLLAAASARQETAVFRSNVDLVALPCTVVDARGAPVSGLAREDFRVTDNGVRRVVEHLWIDEQPLTVGVLIDASPSQEEQLAEHRETARRVLESLLRPGDHTFRIEVSATLRLFADGAGLPQPFGELCPTGICGASPLWNAVYDAARLPLRTLAGAEGAARALLILTDGFDTGSTHTWREAADEAHKADAAVYAVHYTSGFGGTFAPDLARLIAETGGASFGAPKGDYSAIVSRLETDLRRRYVLGFRPEKLSGKVRHEVDVEVTRPELTVRARKVYIQPAR